MEYGVHLPLIDFGYGRFTLARLTAVADTARDAGFALLAANDHLLFSAPWLDGPTALAAVLEHSGHLTLATTVALPVVRGPIPLAKSIAALDVLSGGRMLVGVGPGSSPRDYAAMGLPFEERWPRFEQSVIMLRDLLANGARKGDDPDRIRLRPRTVQPGGPPIWIGSWGSEAGLRRVARMADGWLASAYNTTAEQFAAGRARLDNLLVEAGRNPLDFPDGLATMFLYLTEHRAEADRVLAEVVAPVLRRPPEQLADRLLIGPAGQAVERLAAYAEAGLQRVMVWPIADETTQLERFAAHVMGNASLARHSSRQERFVV